MADATFDDLKAMLGVNSRDQLDEAKARVMIEGIIDTQSALITNPDGTRPTADQILTGTRADWDMLRHGTKTLSELKSDWLNPDIKHAADRGVLHGVSGFFLAGVTIAKSSGQLTERGMVDITAGSVAKMTLSMVGGAKQLKAYLKDHRVAIDATTGAFFNDPVKRCPA